MAHKKDNDFLELNFDELNIILSKNPEKNKVAYSILSKVVKEKEKAFLANLVSKIRAKRSSKIRVFTIKESTNNYSLNKESMIWDASKENMYYGKQIADNSAIVFFYVFFML